MYPASVGTGFSNMLIKLSEVDKDTSFLLSSLPPTTYAAFEHLKRVYLQIQIWLGNDVDIDNWGWKHFSNMLIPITMNQLPAPDHLLQILFCNCKKGYAVVVVERVAYTVVQPVYSAAKIVVPIHHLLFK
ncbi:uncharacterized protein TNCV_3407331 [Trichonephila clavipes]|nr:uncharacterized protein TNCV_3407331 [Trichonephila clavipes]